MSYTVEHFINGKKYVGENEEVQELCNPATNQVQGKVLYASDKTLAVGVEAATRAFVTWSQTTLVKRAQILFKFKTLVE